MPETNMPAPHEVILPAGPEVTLEGLPPDLLHYLIQLGYIHWNLFGAPLLVRRGGGGYVSRGELAGTGAGVAFELSHLDEAGALVFLHILSFSAPVNGCSVLDRRAAAPNGYVLLELDPARPAEVPSAK